MKKLLLFSALLLMYASAMADPIDLARAKKIANDYLVDAAEPVLVKRATRDEAKARRMPAKTAAAAPYYIFSRGEGQGFVIVSGDDCMPQILGYTESGDFIEDQMPPQLLSWLESMGSSIEEAQARGENESRQSPERSALYTSAGVRKDVADRQPVDVLIQTHWKQDWPYNNKTPLWNGSDHSATGCVATAAAQVLYYFHRDLPEELQGSTPTYDFGAPVTVSIPKGTPLKWGIMLNSYGGGMDEEYYDAISTLMLAVGASAWMTYGSSSGTHIENLVSPFSSLFNCSSQHKWLGHTELDKIAYANLLEKRPIVYAGYNSNNEGHAIVLDGYKVTNNTFHFNFGWGGQGDGWYVLEDAGVNGFGYNPCIVYDVKPKKINVQATVSAPQGFYASHENKIRVTLKNKSTFPLEGVYLFLGTSNITPTKLSDAVSSVEQVVPNDGSNVDLYLKAKPTAERTYYLVVTDEKLNVLARQSLEAASIGNDLRFRGIEVCGSLDTETHGGHVFTLVNGKDVDIAVKVMNASDYTYEEVPRIQVLTSEDDGATFTVLGTKNASNVCIAPLSEGEFRYSFASTSSVPIEVGKLYAARLMDPLTSTTQSTVTYESDETMAYFMIREATSLTAKLDGTTLKFSGDWNAHTFEQKVNLRTNAKATVYDLTEVKGVNKVPVLSGKEHNLILVGEGVAAEGVNVINVVTGQADRLSLAVGTDFAPTIPVHAASVSLKLNATPGVWMLVTVPCGFVLPDGIFAKRIDSHSSTGITNKTTNVTSLEAGHTYLLMTASSRSDVLYATDVDILTTPLENVDAAVVGTFVNTQAPAGAFYIDAADENFIPATAEFDVQAFGGYFYSSTNTRAFRCSSTLAMDNAYLALAQSISSAYNIYDLHSDYTTAEATEELLAAIHAAEATFTSRSFTETSEVRSMARSLDELAAAYAAKLDAESMTPNLEVTFLITNPSFERGYTASSTTGTTYGWTVGASVSVRNNDLVEYRGVGADGKYIVCTNKTATVPNNALSQTIEQLPEGVYAMTAMLGTAVGQNVTLFANDQEVTVGASTSGVYYLHEARIDDILIMEGQPLTIGVRAGDWYKADDFRLYFVRPLTDEEKKPTGISVLPATTDRSADPQAVYDLQGRRVARSASDGQPSTLSGRLSKGLYIIDGKKVLIK